MVQQQTQVKPWGEASLKKSILSYLFYYQLSASKSPVEIVPAFSNVSWNKQRHKRKKIPFFDVSMTRAMIIGIWMLVPANMLIACSTFEFSSPSGLRRFDAWHSPALEKLMFR